MAADVEWSVSKEAKTANSLEKAERMLSRAAFLDGEGSNHCVKNLYLAVCAHFYLANMAYEFQKNDKLATLRLLQVLCISPYQARQISVKIHGIIFFCVKVWCNELYKSTELDNYAFTSSSQRTRKLNML